MSIRIINRQKNKKHYVSIYIVFNNLAHPVGLEPTFNAFDGLQIRSLLLSPIKLRMHISDYN